MRSVKAILSYVLLLVLIVESAWIGYKLPKQVEYPAIDSRLAPLVDEFIAEGKKRGVILSPDEIGVMVFTTLPDGEDGVAGFCNSAGPLWAKHIKHSAVVLISKDFEDALDDPNDYVFKSLVFHELGHCLLYRDHDDAKYLTIMTELPIGSPLMPYREMSERYKREWDQQLDDLFLRPNGFPPPPEFLVYASLLENILRFPAFAPRTSPAPGPIRKPEPAVPGEADPAPHRQERVRD